MSSTGNHDQVIQAATQAAVKAVTATAASSTNDMSSTAVADAKPELRDRIEKAIAADPMVQNVTNTEAHFWQKRTFWSSLASGFAALTFIVPPVIQYMQSHTSSDGKLSVSMLGLGFAIWSGYSAWKAGRPGAVPLGTKPANPVSYRG